MTSFPANPATQSGTDTGPAQPPAPNGAGAPAHHHDPQRIPPWLESAELFCRVLLRVYVGLFICYAPWSRYFPVPFFTWTRLLWDQNPLFLQFPAFGHFASLGAVRGIISGLGFLNLWIAFREAIRHRDG
ncbi:MAG TPA: hypothetical protein VGJ21_20775 [Terracidiphilus sp.]